MDRWYESGVCAERERMQRLVQELSTPREHRKRVLFFLFVDLFVCECKEPGVGVCEQASVVTGERQVCC